jgi:lipopolysaccharide export system protein LptA
MHSKIHALMKHLFFPPLLLVCALWGTAVHAERADRDKPMNIEADALRYDDQKQVSVFSGRVNLTKGTIVMRGARLEARQDTQGNQFGTVTAEAGKRAFFRQKREGADEFIEGEAEVIEYDGKADVVRFLRRAELRRYRGATLADEISGSSIQYDNTTDVFTVDGTVTGGSGRVRAMLSPRNAASAPAAAGGAPAIVPSLRPSSRMGERK